MEKHSRSARTCTYPSNALPVVGSLIAGLVMALTFSLVATGCASDTNSSYPRGAPGARGGQMQAPQGPGVYEIITALELEPEQLPTVRAVLEDAEDAREEAFANMRPGSGERPDPSAMGAMREKMDALREDTETRLAELLTTEQMARYRVMMQEAEQQRQQMRPEAGGRGGGRGGGRPSGGGW